MTELEQHLLAIIQDAFPLEERPYWRLAEMLNAQEQAVFDAIENLRRSGIIRRIGGIYDSHILGFISRLCAGKVTDLEKFASAVNRIPAITHNYVRSHEYNVWFTAIAESEEKICAIVDGLQATTDLHDVHILTATKKFKINTVMTRHPGGTGVPVDDCVILSDPCKGESKDPDPQSAQTRVLSADDRARIRIACDDIPHTLTPFKDWNVSVDELREDLAQRRMRRFGAILRHQDAGFAHNAMVCFNADVILDAQHPGGQHLATCCLVRMATKVGLIHSIPALDKVPAQINPGLVLAQKPYISHCYERPAFEGFPYTLYAMMHAQSAEELDAFIKDAATSIGNPEYVVLHSVRELKKTSFRFF